MKLADLKFAPQSDWRPTPVSELPTWPRSGRIAIDVETRDPKLKELGIGVRRGGYAVGISFAIDGGPAHYLPTRHAQGTNLDPVHVSDYVRDQAAQFAGEIIGANLGYDVEYLAAERVKFPHATFRDVSVAEALLDELQLSYSLDNILRRRGLPGKDESLLREAAAYWGVDPKKDLWRLPPSHVGPYAIGDVRRPLALYDVQRPLIEEQSLSSLWTTECRLLPVLVKMRQRGVRIDLDRLDQVEKWAIAKEAEALAEIRRLTGHALGLGDVNKKAILVPILREAGITIPKTEGTEKHPDGQDSLQAKWLATLTSPLGKLINTARRYNKLVGTFVQSVREYQVNGRIHCTLNQARVHVEGRDDDAGARYGRFSCTDPNLQQQPARHPEIGPVWRSIYVPDEGGEWACFDLKQQEPRWAVHYAELLDCPGATAAGDAFRGDPQHDLYMPIAKAAGVSRDHSKIIFLGTLYGMGGGKMCMDMGLPTKIVRGKKGDYAIAGPEGQAIIDAFDRAAPWARKLADLAKARAESRGYVLTAAGRRCRFPRRGQGYDWTHKALNRVVQGSSGDQVKKGMVDADAAGFDLQLQVHDEVDLTLFGRDRVPELSRILVEALPCRVPHLVDVEIGPNWGTLKKVG